MSLFFELIQISLSKRYCFTASPTDKDWKDLFEQAKRQALIGVLFSGVERLPEGQRPPKSILLQWYALVQQIEEKNKFLNKQVVTVSNKFQKDGFKTCILKGQGNALLYPDPLRRQSGDIDIWLNGGRKKILEYTKKICPNGDIRYHHVDFPALKDTSIEVHFIPSYLHNPISNKRLQKWFEREAEKQYNNHADINGIGKICIPTLKFNLIFQLIHIYNHLFDEGIGLRQLMDYNFLLLSAKENCNYEFRIMNYEEYGQSITMNDEIIILLKSLKLYKFAGAVMWVLSEVFALERELMLVEPNEKEGRFLLDEIMMAGNFGHYDPRFGDLTKEKQSHKFIRKLKRNFRFIKSYPSEVFWEPMFRVWHFFWRLWIKCKLNRTNSH